MAPPPSLAPQAHAIYLGVIAVLLIVLIAALAIAARCRSTAAEARRRFGLDDPARASVPREGSLRTDSAATAPAALLRPRTFDEYRKEVDRLIERAGELGEFGKATPLADACAYALRGGKRLRAVIVLEVARATAARGLVGDRDEPPVIADAADAALFVEYLHTASLVVDDLPAFDDDETRRGRPTLHARLGPATAQMAALSLVSGAFANVCRQVDWLRDNCPEFGNPDRIGMRFCAEISRALGATGAAGGQHMDSVSPTGGRSFAALTREYGDEAVTDIMKKKTATLYEIAFVAGWLVGGGSVADLDDVRAAGTEFGTAFQIADDLGDVAQDAARQRAGKPGWNWALVYGPEAATREVDRRLKACRLTLERLGVFTPLWEEVYAKVWEMAQPPPDAADYAPAAYEAAGFEGDASSYVTAPADVGPGGDALV